MQIDNSKFLIMAGPNVIESEKHTLEMAKKLKTIFEKFPKYIVVNTRLFETRE